jgi:hypothetical protein
VSSGFAIVLGALLLVAAAPRAAAGSDVEHAVKAEFLERFTHFVRWPAASFATAESPFVVCVVGTNPFGTYLADLIRKRRLQARRAELRSISSLAQLDGCHVVFIAASERRRITSILDHTGGKPILTVGDTVGFARAGVLINLYLEEGHVRFAINIVAVKHSGLKVSSKLFKLARIVEAEPPR